MGGCKCNRDHTWAKHTRTPQWNPIVRQLSSVSKRFTLRANKNQCMSWMWVHFESSKPMRHRQRTIDVDVCIWKLDWISNGHANVNSNERDQQPTVNINDIAFKMCQALIEYVTLYKWPFIQNGFMCWCACLARCTDNRIIPVNCTCWQRTLKSRFVTIE